MDSRFYTYAHFADGQRLPFYIGKGKGARAYRIHNRSKEWNAAAAGGHHVEILARWHTEADAFSHEKLMISVFNRLCANLVNKNAGGSGQANPSAETRKKIKKTLSNTLQSMKHAMSERMKKKWQDPEYKKRMSEASAAARKTEEFRVKASLSRGGTGVFLDMSEEAKRQRKSVRSKIAMSDPVRAKKHAEAVRMKWQNPEFREKVILAQKLRWAARKERME